MTPRGVVLAILLICGSGCGYSTRSLLPEGIHSVSVDVFGNETFERELGITLTKELSREINHRTSWRVVRRAHADAQLTGRIIRVVRPTTVERANDLVEEQALIVTAEVVLTATGTQRELDRFVVSNRAEFIVSRGESRESAFAEALRDLAEQIVNALQRKSFEEDLEALRAREAEGETGADG